MMLRALLSLLLFEAAALASPAPSPEADAIRVYVGVYVHDVSKLELKDGLFNVDMEYWAKWRGRFDTKLLRVANGDQLTVEPLAAEHDGEWHAARFRARGTLRGEFPVHRFPLDDQTLRVSFELPGRAGELVPDLASSSMARRFSISDWLYQPEFRPEVTRRTLRSDLGSIDHEGQPSVVNRVAFSIRLERPIMTTVLKLFLPLCIVALVAFIALFLHPELIDARSAIGITALLSCFAFQFTIADSLPEVAYLTLADQLFLVAYLFSSVVLVAIVVSYNLHRLGRERAALLTDRALRWALPPLSALAIWIALPAEVPADAPVADPLPTFDHPTSQRDTLRIGSNLRFNSVLSLAAKQGAYWPLADEDPDSGRKRPLLVERLPGVSNRAMRLLSGGGLEVTWRLRRGARWSDGKPLTAEDLLLVRRVLVNDHVAAFEAVDPRTLVIRWKAPLAQSLESPGFWPHHVLGRYATRDRDDSEAYKKILAHRRREPIPSTGPYRIASFEPGSKLVVEANPHFLGKPPAIRRVEEIRYPSRAALFEAFKRGDVEVTVPNGVTMKQALLLRAARPETVHILPSNFLITLAPDLTHPALSKIAVRRALLLALDRARLVREVYGEAGRVAHVPVPGELPPGTLVTPHDPKRARALLRKAGHEALSLKLFLRGSSIDRQIASRLVEDLQRVGVTLELQPVKSAYKVYKTHSHGGLVLHVFLGRRSKSPMAFWNLPLVAGRYPPKGRNAAYTDEVASIVERDLHAIYPERRRQLRDALFAQFSRRLPHLPLMFAAKRVLAHPKLRGWKSNPEAYFGTGLERWHFVK